MHAMGNSLGGMELYTELEDMFPGYQGGFIWDYIDQAVFKKKRMGKRDLCTAETLMSVPQITASAPMASYMLTELFPLKSRR